MKPTLIIADWRLPDGDSTTFLEEHDKGSLPVIIMTSYGSERNAVEAMKRGAYDYLTKGHMIGGFAVIAYPARYGASGIMSFLVNQDGLVYEKNLGENSTATASKITVFNPYTSWKQVSASH